MRSFLDDFDDDFVDGDGGANPGELENEPCGSSGIGDGIEYNAEAGPSSSRAVGVESA